MLTKKLIDVVDTEHITAILPIPKVQKLIVATKSNDVHVYYRDTVKYKHFQTYPNLLKSLHTEESTIHEFYYSHELLTVFAKCEKSIILLNSTNISQYDKIVDKRGIGKCWVFELPLAGKDESMTILIYCTKTASKLRMFIWHGRSYTDMSETSLSGKSEPILSMEPSKDGIFLVTKLGVYFWKFKSLNLTRIDKVVKKTNNSNLVSLIIALESIGNKSDASTDSLTDELMSLKSVSTVTKTSGFKGFWNKKLNANNSNLKQSRYLYKKRNNVYPSLIDGTTGYSFDIEISPQGEPYLIATEIDQLIDFNSNFPNIIYNIADTIILSNSEHIRLVDSETGFSFLSLHIPEGIKRVHILDEPYLIVWTEEDKIKLYHYQVDDSYEHEFDEDEELLNYVNQESEFCRLWRKVTFYTYFLSCPYSLELCSSSNPERSLDLCAMKLRDLTVMFCLQIYNRYQQCLLQLIHQNCNESKYKKIEKNIVENIFSKFILFWAPPQLIISNTFPKRISNYVEEYGNKSHSYLPMLHDKERDNDVKKEYLTQWYLPYLTDIRRHIKNLLSPTTDSKIKWNFMGRSISQNLEFFLVNDHDEMDTATLLKLIDTTLFVVYLYYQPTLLAPFLRVENFCDFDLVAKELENHQLYQELLDFYFTKGEHVSALTLLKKLYETSVSAEDQELTSGIKVLIIRYIKKLSNDNLDLIFETCNWLLGVFQDKDGILLEIFLDDSQIAKFRDHIKVYDYLKAIREVIAIEYLEFIIATFEVDSPRCYKILIEKYLKKIDEQTVRTKLRSILDTTTTYDAEDILHLIENKMNSSDPSNEDFIFLQGLLPFVYRMLGRHEEAVDILFNSLSDYASASSYCNGIYVMNREIGEDLLLYFLKLLIKDDSATKSTYLFHFIKEYYSKIDTVKLLKLIPKNKKLKELKELIIRSVITTKITKEEENMTRNLLQVELIGTTHELNQELSNSVSLQQNSICPICGKNFPVFTTDSVLWFTIDGQNRVVHYNCGKSLQSNVKKQPTADKMQLTVLSYNTQVAKTNDI
ncbi:hypothetical protein Kpol_1055p65 [Vanderwaltozyma polyspora DSM 70294]|uniref:Vacuolar sorting protein 39/Transforming growth factor beta receptor-associated domain-containing protein n=1 Tax=Vanderwaltozyma polyspora (strain ATCC 22028 / DSM 70294 / BCRC 21397 / CBS 2163 / NBRC 10782 / NRRL Y-8283 / UCD 57-17) TaxID=436907 RepID=A7TGD8_VANPO|nr:uncharacterized protein Kpol_1055p65 [Vanderwaltozyma polyspora DSM 70294]EDO18708.1 hypothetical protein Kpol_1055p65 [Vanderwaltozyma polyspora DSM 70294]